MHYNRNSIINLVTDVFCNGEDEKDLNDILKLQAQLQEIVTVGGDPEKIANNKSLIRLLGMDVDVVATIDILSNIDSSNFKYLRPTLLRDRFQEFLCSNKNDKRRLYELVKVLHENNCGELSTLNNLRYEDGKILFEAIGMTLEITGYADINSCYKYLTFDIGGSSRTVLLSEIEFERYPDCIITSQRAWVKLSRRQNNSVLYFPVKQLEAEFVSGEVINEYIRYYPYVNTLEIINRHYVNDMYNIGETLGSYEEPSREELEELRSINNSDFILSDYKLYECCNKYACVIQAISANQFKRFIKNRNRFKDFQLIWNDPSNSINL